MIRKNYEYKIMNAELVYIFCALAKYMEQSEAKGDEMTTTTTTTMGMTLTTGANGF